MLLQRDDLLRDGARMRVAEADLIPVGEEIFIRRVKRRLQHGDLLQEVEAEVGPGADDELREVLERHVHGIAGTLPPDPRLRIKLSGDEFML